MKARAFRMSSGGRRMARSPLVNGSMVSCTRSCEARPLVPPQCQPALRSGWWAGMSLWYLKPEAVLPWGGVGGKGHGVPGEWRAGLPGSMASATALQMVSVTALLLVLALPAASAWSRDYTGKCHESCLTCNGPG